MGYFSTFGKAHSGVATMGSSIELAEDDYRYKRMSLRSTKQSSRSSILAEIDTRSNTYVRPNDLIFRSPGRPLSPIISVSDRSAADSNPSSTEPSGRGLINKIRFGIGSRLLATATAPSQTMPSIPQKKVSNLLVRPNRSNRGNINRDLENDQKEGVDIMASRLNQLAEANSNGLLGDEDYRLLRQMVFDECANTQSTSLSDRSNRMADPIGSSNTTNRASTLYKKPAVASHHERASPLEGRYGKRESRSSTSTRYSSMISPKGSSAEAESSEEILSMIRSVESERCRMIEMFDQMERKLLTEAVENGWIVDRNSEDQIRLERMAGPKPGLDLSGVNSSHQVIQAKLRDVRERRQEIRKRYDLRLDLFRKKLKSAEIKANIMR